MFLTEVQELAESLMESHGLLDKGWHFEFDSSKKMMGRCWYGRNKITLSRVLCRVADVSDVTNTILHEIAHALVGQYVPAHGAEWKRVAKSIGCTAERCHTVSTHTGAKYAGTCTGCGVTTHFHRKPKYDLKTGYRCKKCKIVVVIEKV